MKHALLQLKAGKASWCQHYNLLRLDLFKTQYYKISQYYKSYCFLQNLRGGNYPNCFYILSNCCSVYNLLNDYFPICKEMFAS